MPATTPEEIHRLFEDRFNAGDVDGLMAPYEPDAAVIPNRGASSTVASRCVRGTAAFLALQGRTSLDTKLVVTVGDLAFLSNTWSLTGTGPTASCSP
jgi:ketosteroid isomerase-like protein